MEIEMYEQLPEDAKRIRVKVFMEEQGFENEFDDIDNLSIHFLIFEKAIPVATCRLYFSGARQNYTVGRIAVLKEFRGKNYGGELLIAAEREIIERKGRCIELSAQVRAATFYVKNGYVASDEIHDDEGCPHVWMMKQLR